MSEDPLRLFVKWYEEAGIDPPVNRDVIALATATRDGRPSVRMVFFRGLREGGFSFFTNYESRKGRELEDNPLAALVFYWPHLGRQVRVEGQVERLADEESDRYFQSRSFQSRISAIVSRQSQPLTDTAQFYEEMQRMEQTRLDEPMVRPRTWGGFKLIPSQIEFWTRGEHRRHDRVLYEKTGPNWVSSKLYP